MNDRHGRNWLQSIIFMIMAGVILNAAKSPDYYSIPIMFCSLLLVLYISYCVEE